MMPKEKKKPKKVITYPWNYDEDVISTGKSLETAEGIVGAKLAPPKDGGLGMIFTYDNTKVQYERGTPYGPAEYAKMREGNAAGDLAEGWRPTTAKPKDTGFQYDD